MTTGEKIKNFRERAGLTQADLAREISTTSQNISQYERGIRNPKSLTLEKIAAALNVSTWELLDDDTRQTYKRGAEDSIEANTALGYRYTKEESELVSILNDCLNDEGKKKLLEHANLLCTAPECLQPEVAQAYIASLPAAIRGKPSLDSALYEAPDLAGGDDEAEKAQPGGTEGAEPAQSTTNRE